MTTPEAGFYESQGDLASRGNENLLSWGNRGYAPS